MKKTLIEFIVITLFSLVVIYSGGLLELIQ